MSGNKIGGRKAAKTNREKYGKDFYARIGAKGGRNGKGPNYKGGFAGNPELARIAGSIGGKKSKRTGVKNHEGKKYDKDIEAAERILEEESGRNK